MTNRTKNIFVSGTSGIVGYGILKSLKQSGLNLKLFGATIYDDSVAQGFCDVFIKAPLTNAKEYIPWVLTIIKRYKIDMLIPGIDDDMYMWANNIEELEKENIKILINNIDLIQLCNDKWTFYNFLINKKSPYVIPSSLSKNFDELVDTLGLPLLLKPRHGFGSKGIIKIHDNASFLLHKDEIGKNLMVQPYIGNDDEEYTTSAYCDGKGGFYNSMTLRRKLSKDGFTEKAEVVNLNEINHVLSHLCTLFTPYGPTNFQFRIHNNTLLLLEINPRISSATSIRTRFGYNESKMAVEHYLENKLPEHPIIKEGKAVRYIEDFIFYQ